QRTHRLDQGDSRRRAPQSSDPDQQPPRRPPTLHPHRRPRQHRDAHPGALAAMRKALFIFLSAAVTLAHAQTYASKPIRLIVPFAPGGSSEFVARTVSAEMAKALGQNFVVENKPGGAGVIAMGEVARAEPDGYTL